jgi:hypothetical protein
VSDEAQGPSPQETEFTRTTRRRRVFFALAAFGVAGAAVVAAVLLFGGQLQTSERARAGQAADELRGAFNKYREQCQGLWRDVFAIDWARIPEIRSRAVTQRLREGVTCEEVAAFARELPRRAETTPPSR